MKRWQWALLIFELALFAVILILPQVDLPDFTFHGGTAPVVAKTRLSAPPVRIMVAATPLPLPSKIRESVVEAASDQAPPDTESRLSLICARRC